MPESTTERSAIYATPEGAEGVPVLLGTCCQACGRLFFPPRRYGCPGCGALPERLCSTAIEGRGALRALAVVRRSLSPDPPLPYAVAQVALDAGIELEVVIGDCDFATLGPGSRVRARLDRSPRDEASGVVERLRFVPDEDS